jgi:hypothetical protein
MTWFEKNREFYLKEKQFVSKYYPGLTFDDSEKILKLKGQFAFIAEYEELETLKNIYEIKIVFPTDYPKSIPKVYEIAGKITSFHRNKDIAGSLCLGIPSEIYQIFSTTPNLKNFFDNLLTPFLYSHTYYVKYKKLSWGEKAHGGKGIIQYYQTKLNTKNNFEILDFLEMSLQKKYRGHVLCPCGSNKKLRNCHINFLKKNISIDNTILKHEIEQIYKYLIGESEDKVEIENLQKRIKIFLNKIKKLCK